jgi:SAM-dependent methyltransferase
MTSIFDETPAGFDAVDRAAATDTFAGYLDGVADRLGVVKARLHDLLGAGPGGTVLDVGCGTGVDVLALARRVGPGGRVVGVDNSQALVDAAVEHAAGTGLPVEFRCGDAHELPFPDGAFDAVRCERVMMHLADPERAVRELLRVTSPGGRVLVADPDHGMWALDAADIPLTRTVLTWWFDNIANPWAARRSPALLRRNGLAGLQVSQLPITLLDLGAAAAITGVTRAAGAAAAAGVITAGQRERFDADLHAAAREGRFLLCGSMVVTAGTAPGNAG